MPIEGNEKNLLEKAQTEEKKYNWIKAAEIYQTLIKSLKIDKKMAEAAKISHRLGFVYKQAADTAESSNEYLGRSKKAIKMYENASTLFNQLDNKALELECQAEMLFVKADIVPSHIEVIDLFKKSSELLLQSSEFFTDDEDLEGQARTLSRSLMASAGLSFFSMDLNKKQQFIRKGKRDFENCWKISKEIGNVEFMDNLLYAMYGFTLSEINYETFWLGKLKEERKKDFEEYILKCEQVFKHIENYSNFQTLGDLFTNAGYFYCFYGIFHLDNELQSREYVRNGLNLLEKGLKYALITNHKYVIINNIFWSTFFALLGTRYDFIQKRIPQYLQLCEKIENICSNSFNRANLSAKLLLPIYYTLISSGIGFVFQLAQRISYTNKAIEAALKYLEFFHKPSDRLWIVTTLTSTYSNLVISYSFLAHLAQSREEQDENKKYLLQYTKKCENILKIDNIGLNKANCYNAIFQAYQTLADISENVDEKIEMLTIAMQALEKNLEYIMWGPAGPITSRLMLGTRVLELGILTKNTNTIKKSRDIFLNMLNESNEKGFLYYAAVAQEYLAHIEDRLGNHTTSAMYYEKAQSTRKEQLRYVEYPPLQNLAKNRIEYDDAWRHIEEAKAYHKRENHLKAKESYQTAHRILNKLPHYNYEAPYYIAWASLEEAEHFSKQEKPVEAIEQYEKTSKLFESAIKNLYKAINQNVNQYEKNRIRKLEKVAKIRIDYCSARINVESARNLGKEGKHIIAAEKFALAALQFNNICSVFKIGRERKELEAIYYLCRAWESMELAENYEEPDRFTDAANLFTKAGNLFTDVKYRLLALGNSAFCQALEYGCKFDDTIETEIKAQIYPKVKKMLNKAASSYRKGGFQNGTEWILATSTYFDAVWNLLRANDELNLDGKKKFLGIGSGYLRSAADLFGNSGYKNKEKEVIDHLQMVEKEEKILLSAVSTITKPSISRSTIGIVAPTCPIEISNSTDLSEIQAITEESFRNLESRQGKSTKEFPQLAIEQPIILLIIAKGGVLIFSYPFIEDLKFDDELISGFLTAFNSFSDELFSKGLDRAKFGDYSVIMESIADFSVCYLFKGQIIPAKQKLTQFIERIQKIDSIWQTLNKFSKISQVVEIRDIPSLNSLITELFL